jgi:signal transduction histidine kinase
VRIIGAFLIAMVSMLVAVGFLVNQYQDISRTQAIVTEGYLPLSQAVDSLRIYQERVDRDLARLMRDERRATLGNDLTVKIYNQALADTLKEARVHTQHTHRLATDPEEHAHIRKVESQIDRLDTLFQAYEEGATSLLAAFKDAVDDGYAERVTTLQRHRTDLADEIDRLEKSLDGRIASLTQQIDAMRIAANSFTGMLTLVAAAVSCILLGAVLLALQPITRLTAEVQRLTTGDYTGRVKVTGADEIAFLGQEFNTMVEALQERDQVLVDRAEELRTLSRHLGSVLDTLEDALLVVEGDMVTLANPAARTHWGVEQGRALPDELSSLVDQEGVVEERSTDGRVHQARTTRFGQSGHITVIADITDQTEAREKLIRSERLALIGQMLAQITHEVRNPLNALSLNSELLSDELTLLDPDKKTEAWDLLDTVSGEIERLTGVTHHYLQLAKRPLAQMGTTDLGEIVRDTGRLVQAELEKEKVKLTSRLHPIPPQEADPGQIRQALLNILRNAVEAEAKHLTLILDHDADHVTIRLEDDGGGMSSDQLQKSTEPFFSTKSQGTGLGLAITRQIVEDHGGHMTIETTEGQGTTLTLTLPRRDVDESLNVNEPVEVP